MKKILNILLFTTLCLFIAGCSDDDDPVQGLTIVKSNILFDAEGGEGDIQISNAQGNLEVTSENAWCKVSASGTTIKVTADINTSIIGRSSLITIKSGGETQEVVAMQNGMAFGVDKSEVYVPVTTAGEVKIKITNSLPFTFDKDADWFDYTVEGDEIIITTQASSSPRKGLLTLISGDKRIEIPINQTLLTYEDLLGTWTLAYTDYDDIRTTANIELAEGVAGESYILKNLPPFLIDITLNFDASTGRLYLNAGQVLGNIGTTTVTVCLWNWASATRSTTVQYEGNVELDTPKITYSFDDNGSWSGYTVYGVLVCGWTGSSITSIYEALDFWVMEKQ